MEEEVNDTTKTPYVGQPLQPMLLTKTPPRNCKKRKLVNDAASNLCKVVVIPQASTSEQVQKEAPSTSKNQDSNTVVKSKKGTFCELCRGKYYAAKKKEWIGCEEIVNHEADDDMKRLCQYWIHLRCCGVHVNNKKHLSKVTDLISFWCPEHNKSLIK